MRARLRGRAPRGRPRRARPIRPTPPEASAPYPIALHLRGRDCLVVGGGPVAEGKVGGLLEAGARVTIVSPAVTERLREWIEQGRCRHLARAYRPRDVVGRAIALVATGDVRVTARVHRDARRAGVLVNAADDPERCDFFLPAVLRRGRLVVAVSTGGASPTLARVVRDELERLVPESYALLLEVVAAVRADVRQRQDPVPADRWRAAIDDRLRALVAEGQVEEATALALDAAGGMSARRGRVFLVGAGPGDPRLITVRGLELLRQADVVVHDRLVSPALLDEVRPRAIRIFAGKSPGAGMSQEAINRLLIHHARLGRRVVRLKGGDPFVFGRGGEEALALADAGIPFEIVPGVSSAVGVPAYAGIPVTHRALSSSFAVVTGSEDPEKSMSRVDWAALATRGGHARDPDAHPEPSPGVSGATRRGARSRHAGGHREPGDHARPGHRRREPGQHAAPARGRPPRVARAGHRGGRGGPPRSDRLVRRAGSGVERPCLAAPFMTRLVRRGRRAGGGGRRRAPRAERARRRSG